jgi:hypothetical protein
MSMAARARRLIGVALFALGAPVAAQGVDARAFVTPGTTVAVGSAFVVNVEVSGTQSMNRDLAPPDLGAFARFLGSNTQSSVQMVNGRTTVSVTVQHRYQALTEGVHTIPPMDIVAEGRSLTTDPITVTISADAAEGVSANGIAPDELFITAEASRTSVREGEPFVVEYRIWTKVDVTNFGMTAVPEPAGFWVEDVSPQGPPQVEERTRGGEQYATAVVRRVALVPTGPGQRTIDPIGIEAAVRVQTGRDPFERVFGRPSLFGTTTVPVTVLSNPLTIDVVPLPPGRPDLFTGVVGSLRVTADVDRDSVDANEAITLTVRVTGDGHLRSITPPALGLPDDFEVFPPEISETIGVAGDGLSGAKTFEYVVIPRAPGQREIPPVALAYFDGATGAYREVASDPIPLTVAGTVLEGPAALTRGGVEQLRQDIRFIRLGSLELGRSGGSVLSGPGFWMFALLPLMGIAGAVALRRHRDLLEGDVAYARGRRAGRVARRRLADARRLAEQNDRRAFYAEVARALTGLISDRLNLAEAGLESVSIERALERVGAPETLREDVIDCLAHCDRQRFAPPAGDPDETARFLERVERLMDDVDRAVR